MAQHISLVRKKVKSSGVKVLTTNGDIIEVLNITGNGICVGKDSLYVNVWVFSQSIDRHEIWAYDFKGKKVSPWALECPHDHGSPFFYNDELFVLDFDTIQIEVFSVEGILKRAWNVHKDEIYNRDPIIYGITVSENKVIVFGVRVLEIFDVQGSFLGTLWTNNETEIIDGTLFGNSLVGLCDENQKRGLKCFHMD